MQIGFLIRQIVSGQRTEYGYCPAYRHLSAQYPASTLLASSAAAQFITEILALPGYPASPDRGEFTVGAAAVTAAQPPLMPTLPNGRQ